MAAIDQLTGLMSLINGVKGQSQTTKTSGGTTTQQTNVSDQGIQEILKTILSGSGGVKDIGSRARSSGLYNSTTEGLLLDNLYATAANKAELARSPTVTTSAPQTSTTTTPGTGIGGLAGTLGTAFLASQALNLGSKALAPTIESGANYVTDLLGGLFGTGTSGLSSNGGSDTGTGKKSGNIFDGIDFGGFGGQIGGTSASSGTGFSSGEGYGINTSTLGNFGGSSGVDGAKGLNFGMDLDSGAGSVGVGGFGAIGSILGSVLGGLAGNSGGSSGGGGGTSGGSVICTALKDRGLLDRELHAAGEAYLSKLPLEVKVGYQSWAIDIADKITEGHEGWTKVCLPFAASRTGLLATAGTFVDHLKFPLGTITKFIGEPICGLIGKMVMNKISQMKGA